MRGGYSCRIRIREMNISGFEDGLEPRKAGSLSKLEKAKKYSPRASERTQPC